MVDLDDDPIGEAELIEGLEKKKISGKKIVIIIGAILVGFFLIKGLSSLLSGSNDDNDPTIDKKLDEIADEQAAKKPVEQDVPNEKLQLLFYEIPEMLVNLNTASGLSFLKIKITLEIDRESYRSDLDAKLPRILDDFQVYLRELRPDDLTGSQGIFRLKEELLSRINQSVAPTRVKDVLFEEFIVQGGTA